MYATKRMYYHGYAALRTKKIDSNTELYGRERLQEAGDPFVLHRYRASPETLMMNGHVQIDE